VYGIENLATERTTEWIRGSILLNRAGLFRIYCSDEAQAIQVEVLFSGSFRGSRQRRRHRTEFQAASPKRFSRQIILKRYNRERTTPQ
jgi:hypothetical protein